MTKMKQAAVRPLVGLCLHGALLLQGDSLLLSRGFLVLPWSFVVAVKAKAEHNHQ